MKPLKYYLWKFDLLKNNKCPFCSSKLIEHGYMGRNHRWTCQKEDCRFNSPSKKSPCESGGMNWINKIESII